MYERYILMQGFKRARKQKNLNRKTQELVFLTERTEMSHTRNEKRFEAIVCE